MKIFIYIYIYIMYVYIYIYMNFQGSIVILENLVEIAYVSKNFNINRL